MPEGGEGGGGGCHREWQQWRQAAEAVEWHRQCACLGSVHVCFVKIQREVGVDTSRVVGLGEGCVGQLGTGQLEALTALLALQHAPYVTCAHSSCACMSCTQRGPSGTLGWAGLGGAAFSTRASAAARCGKWRGVQLASRVDSVPNGGWNCAHAGLVVWSCISTGHWARPEQAAAGNIHRTMVVFQPQELSLCVCCISDLLCVLDCVCNAVMALGARVKHATICLMDPAHAAINACDREYGMF